MALVTASSWSALAIALKFALKYSSSGTIAWYRFVVASLALGAILGLFHKESFKSAFKLPPLVYVAGLGLALNYFGFMKGIEYTSPSNAQIFIQMSQIMFVAVGLFYFKEQLRAIQRLGFVVASFGFALFFFDQLQTPKSFDETFGLGVWWIFIASVTWVLFATIQKVLSQKYSPNAINLNLYLVCAVLLLPAANFSEMLSWSPWVWLLMSLLGLNTLVAYGALGYALKLAPANQVSLIIACNPIFTLFFMEALSELQVSWLADESVGIMGYIGAFVVVCGVGLAVQRSRRRKSVA